MHCRFIKQFFCEEVYYAVAFFKVVQQQTIFKVGNQLYVCGQIISVCSSERILKSDGICESYAQMKKGPIYLTHSVFI